MKHQDEVRIKSAERKAKLKEKGLCKDCGAKTYKKLSLCQECNSKAIQRNKLKVIQRQLDNKCTCCGGEKKDVSKAYCNTCSLRDNQRLRDRAERAKENNICIRCRKNNSIDGGSFCENCYTNARTYHKVYRDTKFFNGICQRCPNLKVDDKLLCHSCSIENNIRKNVASALLKKQIPKSLRTEEMLGCTIKFFREHIRNLMEPWMNEKNYGVHIPGERRWQLGHRMPVASFDLLDTEQLKKCWHYTNLYPQEAKENILMQDFLIIDGGLVRGRDLKKS